MHWLLIGYLFLFIDRPFEVWPILGDLHLERAYFLFMTAWWAIAAPKRFPSSALHAGYIGFAFALAASWAMSPWSAAGQPVLENWLKILAFYILLVTSIHDEKGLKRIVIGFVGVMFLYMLHSMKEYLGGRHTYRMGIVRMLGVDDSQGDPNSFAASILFALPFVPLLWHTARNGWMKCFCLGFYGLSFACIGLTGSRAAFLGLGVWLSWSVLRSKQRWLGLAALIFLSPVGFLLLPESLQTRFETIIDPSVGPANAVESGEGRLEGLATGWELFQKYPFTGCGPGAWRPATHSKIESHNLYGQVMGETGLLGVIAFGMVVLLLFREARLVRKESNYPDEDFQPLLAQAIATSLVLMLLEGNFGHNLFRHNWVWYGAFLVAARAGMLARSASEGEA